MKEHQPHLDLPKTSLQHRDIGLSKPAIVPYFMFGFINFIEKLFSPLFLKIALFQTIIARKK